jgi:hypothetical protein
MTIPAIGLAVSALLLTAFSILFQYEARRGVRYARRFRLAADSGVVSIVQTASTLSQYIGRAMIRQTMHYLFHKMLTSVLHFLEESEHKVQRLLRRNKTVARKLDVGERPKNKLDEIAEHKQSVALSEEEKKKHKEKMLEE